MSELNTNNMVEAVETEVPQVGLDAGSDLNIQTGGGGDGVRLGLEQPHIGGQAEVQGYNQEVGAVEGWGNGGSGDVSDLNFKQVSKN